MGIPFLYNKLIVIHFWNDNRSCQYDITYAGITDDWAVKMDDRNLLYIACRFSALHALNGDYVLQ